MAFENEKPITLAQASRKLPNRPHKTTVYRWCKYGIQGVFLEHGKMGRSIVTSVEACMRFSRALQQATAQAPLPAANVVPITPRPQSPKQRQASIERAYDNLAKRGITVDQPVQHAGNGG